MIKVDNVKVEMMSTAIRGMRNPKDSWDKSDSRVDEDGMFILGKNDLKLAKALISGGSVHRKFLRQIFVGMDITAPLYWWKEFDTYKVGTVSDSCSTIHTISKKKITEECFSIDSIYNNTDQNSYLFRSVFKNTVDTLEDLRNLYNNTGDKKYFTQLIQMLPSSWNQMRTVTFSYENALAFYHDRRNHKLSEWVDFVHILYERLPYLKEFIDSLNEK